MPTVSVIIPAYNQGQFVGQAIQSVLDQTYIDFEVIVVDDGSTDETRDAVQAFRDDRVRYVYQLNRGLSAARNSGIRNTTGGYLTYLDADDLFLPRKLEVLVRKLQSSPDLGLAAGQAIPVDEQGERVGAVFDKGLAEDPANLLMGNPLHVGSVLLRRSCQERVGLFDESLRSYEDWDMWLRLTLAGCQMAWIDQPVSLYRFHSNQMTRNQSQMTEASFAVLDKLFGRDDLPANWRELKNAAYSQAHMRGAAQAYRSCEFDQAKGHLIRAVDLNPRLCADDCEKLANQITAWTDLPKVGEPLEFLERIYGNLPEELVQLRKRRRRDLGGYAIRQAFVASRSGDAVRTRNACLRAIRYQPKWLTNRGAVSILVRAWATSVSDSSTRAGLTVGS